MLVGADQEPARLFGYVTPLPERSGFVLPVFQKRDSNQFFLQEMDSHEIIKGWRSIEPRGVISTRLREAPTAEIGRPALWAFLDVRDELHIGTRENLRQRLMDDLPNVDEPFLRLQIAQFCDLEAEIVAAWRGAFDHIAELAPRSASAWRDVVLVPANVRSAIRQAIIEHGLDAAVTSLGRDVEVSLEKNKLHVVLGDQLYHAIENSAPAKESINRGTALVREAFGLSPAILTAAPTDIVEAQPPVAEPNSLFLATIGQLGATVAEFLVPGLHQRRNRAAPPYPGDENRIIVAHDKKLIFDGIWGDEVRVIEEIDDKSVLVVIFEANSTKQNIADAAIDLANARPAGIVLAVIPHFPVFSGERSEAEEELWRMLEERFDAIYIASDRSPYTRKTLAYGPSRSTVAAAHRVVDLLQLLESGQVSHGIGERAAKGERISVITSAEGPVGPIRLLEHATMRMIDPALDFSTVNSVFITMKGGREPRHEELRSVILREVGNSMVVTSWQSRAPSLGAETTAVLRAARINSRGVSDFQSYCESALKRHGWQLTWDRSLGADLVISRDDLEIPVEFKAFDSRMQESALRGQPRREAIEERIWLTNASIKRSYFARSVLAGITPIHVSKISSLQYIFEKRNVYALNSLDRSGVKLEAFLLTPALELVRRWIQSGEILGDRNIGEISQVTIDPLDPIHIGFANRRIDIKLPIRLVTELARAKAESRLSINLKFDAAGWGLRSS